ncbi:MAG: hypothetical protein AUK35_05805 [Zetaproteobacteria bacterium CG2_30_46_52]|nr:MAG: hypothetical protein AUK35_05805 [Zetaproteobacteria bacterium CG2_30_46_52]
MFKLFFWVALIGSIVFVSAQVIPVKYNNMTIENVFEGAVSNLNTEPVAQVLPRLRVLLSRQNVDLKALPEEFFENLTVTKEDDKLTISSEYHVTIWLLGKPTSIDPDSEYLESDVEPMDKLRLKARLDFDFLPTRVTP